MPCFFAAAVMPSFAASSSTMALTLEADLVAVPVTTPGASNVFTKL